MWWPDKTEMRALRVAFAFCAAALTAGCFQPLYGSVSANAGSPILDKMRAVQIKPIDAANGTPIARLAVLVQDELSFQLTGGSGESSTQYQLVIALSSSNTAVIVDPVSGLSNIRSYDLAASYTLNDASNGRRLIVGSMSTRVSFESPSAQQRFALARGQHDAETRAATEIAQSIRARLTSYFVNGA